jgi:beta-mannosidase
MAVLTRTLLSGAWELTRAPLAEGPRGIDSPLRTGSTDGLPESVEVPGNLQVQLGFQDLWVDSTDLTSLNQSEWLYSRTFDLPAEPGRHFLVFDGIDYFCDVWVNGRWAGHHEGAFSEWELEVTELLGRAGKTNSVTLALSCPWRVEGREFYLNPSSAFGFVMKDSEYMKGDLLHFEWWRAALPFGPWRDVWLETRTGVVLQRLSASTRRIAAEAAEVELHFEWWNGSEQGEGVEVVVSVVPEAGEEEPTSFRTTFEIPSGTSETGETVTITQPQLWWTWDQGEQNLYRATATYEGGQTETVFGIRELRRDPETLAYYLNGRRLFLRGVWYPFANIFSAVPSAQEHWRDVEMLREGNSNHLVSFTFVEKPAFYEACDRLGILVFQELPYYQGGPVRVVDPSYPRFREYWEWSLGQVENIVKQLRGHASVVLWGAFAETRKDNEWVWADYTDYSAEIEKVVTRVDPDAIYHASFCDFKETHIWEGGFPYGEFWDHYGKNAHYISEFGAISPPVVESIRELIPGEAAWSEAAGRAGRLQLPIDAVEWTYRCAFDYPGLTTTVARMFRWADREPPTLERLVDAMQWYQAFGLQYCAETYRRKRFADIGGCRTWSYRDNLPGLFFTVVDTHQRPKIGYFGLKAGYEPVLLSLDEPAPLRVLTAGSRFERELSLINDLPRALEPTVEVELFDVHGRRLHEQSFVAAVGPDSAVTRPLAIDLPSESGAYLLRLSARDGATTAVKTERWLQVVGPVAERPVRVLLLGQTRYNAPFVEALSGVPGVELTVLDEVNRDPQDPSWSEGLGERFDVVWYAGWDYGAHVFSEQEWANVTAAVHSGVGFVHTGGQGSFHGGDGRGALIDLTALDPALPVSLRPHDGLWDRVPEIDPGTAPAELEVDLAGFPYKGLSRTEPRKGAVVHATIDGYPLLVTGRYGDGRTAVFTASLTPPLRLLPVGDAMEEAGWEEPLQVEPPWAREDIKAYGPYWRGTQQLALGLLRHASGIAFRAGPQALAEELQRPLFEQLAELKETSLEATVERAEWNDQAARTEGVVRVRNAGEVVARLVRGSVRGPGSDWRFRDGFVDLLPGEEALLRFETAAAVDTIEALKLRGQNTATASVRLEVEPAIRA